MREFASKYYKESLSKELKKDSPKKEKVWLTPDAIPKGWHPEWLTPLTYHWST
jgi:hypothetical protein